MTQSKMTPGTWEARDSGRVVPSADRRRTLAQVYSGVADTRAIAAVPDLLQALHVALSWVEKETPQAVHVLKTIRGAIAKAGAL